MFLFTKKMLCALGITFTTLSYANTQSNELYIYNWAGYITPQSINDFEERYGIKVHYQVMDSNEILEAKMMAGSSGYDIVAPSLHVLKRLSDLGLLEKLDKNKLSNWSNLDELKLAKIAKVDTNNDYGVPFMELSTGIGFNEKKVKEIMGDDFVLDGFNAVFDDKIASKLKQCGISFLDSPSDMICSAQIYLKKDPQSPNEKDYAQAEQLLKDSVKNILYIHNSKYIEDLVSGEICVSVGWSGDVMMASYNAKQAKRDEIKYIVPKEGALTGFDMLAIPKDAKNKENAYLFLNYMLEPQVIAQITNYTQYANPNKAANAYVDKEILNNPGIYYPQEYLERMYIVTPPTQVERVLTKIFNRVKTHASQGE